MLQVENLEFSWEPGAVLSYDLSVSNGEILAVRGSSGVGKTTLLELIAGFQQPDRGRILWKDKDLTELPPWERPVTSVFQSDNLFGHLSCFDNVVIGLGGRRADDALRQQINECFDLLGLQGLQQRLPSEISGGQQQRVALARALIRAKPILLLDESFSALDWTIRQGCFDALRAVVDAHDMATLLVSHDDRDAEYLECRQLLLRPPETR